jgi:hypothetical protein
MAQIIVVYFVINQVNILILMLYNKHALVNA